MIYDMIDITISITFRYTKAYLISYKVSTEDE